MNDKMSQEEVDLVNASLDEAKKLLEAASIQLMRYRPFYGTLVSAMPMRAATGWLDTIATDGRNLYFNPEFIAGMSPGRKAEVIRRIDTNHPDPKDNAKMKEYIETFFKKKTAREVCFLWEHEVRHIVQEFWLRSRGYNVKLFNIAADHYINTSLVLEHSKADELSATAWFPKGKDTQFDKSKEFGFMSYGYCDFQYVGMFTEQIYDHMVTNSPPSPAGGLSGTDTHASPTGDIGKGMDRGEEELGKGDVQDALGLDVSKQPHQTQSQRNANQTIMRHAIENAVKAAGAGAPEDARRLLAEEGKPRVNYLRLLRRTVERLFKKNVSFRRLHRRSHSMTHTLRNRGIIDKSQYIALPAYMKEKTINVHLGFDVSGSFTDDLLKPTIREIKGLCNLYDEFEATLFCWSTQVGEVKTYTRRNVKDIKDYKIKTTHGTDASCIFEMLDKRKEPVDQVVIYTDGEFSDISKKKDWAKKYGNKTLWVILGRPTRAGDWTPPFGKVVMFDKLLK